MAQPNPDNKTKTMLKAYRQQPNIDKNMFLTSFFKTTAEDITDSEFISIDVERSDEDIAPTLIDISTGAHVISEEVFTNKTIKPPANALKEPFNIWDLMKRQVGKTEYETGKFQGILAGKVMRSWKKMVNMIKRTIEQQAANILQTGTITLYNADGVAVYVLDYKPKTTHFPTASVAWSTVTADMIGDLESLADVIRDDGLIDPEDVIMGSSAFKNFVNGNQAAKYFNKDVLNLGQLNPNLLNNGGKFQGTIQVGNYKLNIWTYGGRYINLNGGAKTKYIGDDNVVMLPNAADLDFRKVFGGIPVVVNSLAEVRQFLPSRVTVPGAFDFKPRVYTDEPAETTYSEVKSRPLLVPVSIDRYGCLDTTP
jgi:hypothetical protein